MLIPFGIQMFVGGLTLVAMVFALPSALATWFSRCYGFSLAAGFGIVFLPVAAGLVSLAVPVKFRRDVSVVAGLLLSVLLIGGVLIQFAGKCHNLGYKPNSA